MNDRSQARYKGHVSRIADPKSTNPQNSFDYLSPNIVDTQSHDLSKIISAKYVDVELTTYLHNFNIIHFFKFYSMCTLLNIRFFVYSFVNICT